MQKFLSPADVASQLNLDEHTVEGFLTAGRLQGQERDGTWLTTPEDIQRFLREEKEIADADTPPEVADRPQDPGWHVGPPLQAGAEEA